MNRFFPGLLVLLASVAAGGCSKPQPDGAEQSPKSAEIVSEPTDELWRSITKAYAEGAGRFRIPPGTHRLKAPPGEAWCLPLRDMKNFEIDATGSTLVVEERGKRFLLFEDCDGVTLKGATVTRAIPAFSQGRIEAVAEDRRSVQVRICQGYPADIESTVFFTKVPVFNIVDPQTRRFKAGIPDIYLSRFEKLQDGVFRFHLREPLPKDSRLNAGDFAAWRGTVETDLGLRSCRNVLVENVTVKGAAGMVFQETCGEGGNRFVNCRITYGDRPPGAAIDPLLSSNADGFHSSSMRKGFTLENCHTEGLHDDAVAIHGAYGMVMESKGERLTIDSRVVMNRRTGLNPFCAAGDRLRIYDTKAAFAGEAVVKSVRQRSQFTPAADFTTTSRFFKTRTGALYWDVELDRPLELKPGWFVANLNGIGSDFVIRGCTMKNQRGRGMLLRAHNGLVENCTVEGTIGAGILIIPEVLWWNESDYVENLTMRGNVIRNVCLDTQPFSGAMTVAAFEHGEFVAFPNGHRAVTIENNVFEDNNGINLLVSSSSGVKIDGNRFIRPMHGPACNTGGLDINYGAVVWIGHSTDVLLQNNSVQAPGSFMNRLIETTGQVTGSGLENGVEVR